MKTVVFWFECDCLFFLRVLVAIWQHCFRSLLGTEKAMGHYLDQWWSRLLKPICVTPPQWVKVPYLVVRTQRQLNYNNQHVTLVYVEPKNCAKAWTKFKALTLYVPNFQRQHKHLFIFYVILPHWHGTGNWPTYSTHSVSWLLMTWRRMEPMHQQPWYLLRWTGSIRSPHVKGWYVAHPLWGSSKYCVHNQRISS